ncbi:MAG: hypothetical protein AB7O32_01420 [Vicinamibacterales bacterium]
MDDRPDVLEAQVARTRERLDRDLDRLDSRVQVAREQMKAQAQWWTGVSLVSAGTIGAMTLWPRRRTFRR